MSVPGVQRHSSALRLSSTCLVICLAGVDTGTTVSAVTCRRRWPMIARCGTTVTRVCSTSCVAGVHLQTILPSDSASTEISPVFLRLVI